MPTTPANNAIMASCSATAAWYQSEAQTVLIVGVVPPIIRKVDVAA